MQTAKEKPGAIPKQKYIPDYGKPNGTEKNMANGERKIHPGMSIISKRLIAISDNIVNIPDSNRLIHLQFRRFAGCPVCNLHLRSMARHYKEIEAAGIREVVVFHSSAEKLLVHAGDLPFDIIADPKKRLYAKFGVESSPRSLLNPWAWRPVIRAVFYSLWGIIRKEKPIPPIFPHGGSFGLPADFLIANDGQVAACKYGEHADDHWSVDELIDISRFISRKEGINE